MFEIQATNKAGNNKIKLDEPINYSSLDILFLNFSKTNQKSQ